ncbi:hypothetical protein TI39_contig622g00011 [Zymoseptoria brevis]|uniref:Uncharacterized protein n=1 Tax=Zymoseptoria brevis TaxID=1047168 RepID=A0A0F4GGH9_9PEZI|nr:hypothetical protein TI39_contig622g00011 [Zymoseptoria brevis]
MKDNSRTRLSKSPNARDRLRVTQLAHTSAHSSVPSSMERTFTVFANAPQQTRNDFDEIRELNNGQRRIIKDATSSHILSASKVRAGLKMLPQELRDQIQELTFTVDWICREK